MLLVAKRLDEYLPVIHSIRTRGTGRFAQRGITQAPRVLVLRRAYSTRRRAVISLHVSATTLCSLEDVGRRLGD